MNKVLLRTMTVAVAIFFALSAQATELPFSLYISKDAKAKKIVLNLDNMQADKVKCTIYSKIGGIIFTDDIYTAEKTAKKYDLSRLPTGDYTVQITDLMKVETLDITVTESRVLFNNPVAYVTFKPTVWVNDDKSVDFNILSLGNNVRVRLYDLANEELYNEVYKKQTSISKKFNLTNLPSGTYTLEVSNGDQTFYNLLTI